MVKEIAIIGNGKAAQYLGPAFSGARFTVTSWARSPKNSQEKDLSQFREATALTLLAVADEAIAPVSEQLPPLKGILAHISGSVPLSALAGKHPHRAIFYPLMSLSGQVQTPLKEVPFCLESVLPEDLHRMEQMVDSFAGKHYRVNSQQRPYLHLAAVLAHNFSNHLFSKAFAVCQEQDLDFQLLKPLLQQAVENLGSFNPAQLQTGPAVRADEATLEAHRAKLKNPQTLKLYNTLTESIQKQHEEKL